MTVAEPIDADFFDPTPPGWISSAGCGSSPVAGGRRGLGPELTRLADILAGPLPDGLPALPRTLSRRLRENDDLARRVWSHPVFPALLVWATRYHPAAGDAWEEMAVYALARARHYQAGRLSVGEIRRGVVNTARWVGHRGRHGERLDSLDHIGHLSDLVAPPLVVSPDQRAEESAGAPRHGLDVCDYLAAVVGEDLPAPAGVLIEETWRIAREHYAWLIDLTGLQGNALVAAAQARNSVNRSRRLLNRLPRDWPPATRKAAALLFTGSPSAGQGLLAWWAASAPGDVPNGVRRRWGGLLAVIDPEVGNLSEEARRLHRERARHWAPGPDAQTTRIAV
jgi:hypothetical protein